MSQKRDIFFFSGSLKESIVLKIPQGRYDLSQTSNKGVVGAQRRHWGTHQSEYDQHLCQEE